jgi:hypothetical protein
MGTPTWGLDPKARTITVYYEGSDTIYEGYALCYNQDTTDNWLGVDGSKVDFTTTASTSGLESTTTAEGYQNEGKFIRVEKPATANLQWLAGFVVGTSKGFTGPGAVDIYVPNGAIVPVYTNKSCTIGQSLGITDGSYLLQAVTGDGTPVPCAQVMETVDRSSDNGIALAKVFPTGQQVSATNAHFAPVRSSATSGREYGVKIDGDNFFVGTTAAQSYLLELSGDKAAAYDTTGDGYSAYLHISGSNYAQNDTNYTYRGINCSISNRSAGTLGNMYGANISISLKSGSGNITNGIACQIDAQDLTAGTKTAFGGLDVAINREGTAATEEFGMRLRTRGTINTAVNTVFRIDKDAADHGFVNLFNIEADGVDVAALSGDKTFDTSDIGIPIVYNGTTYYIIASDST